MGGEWIEAPFPEIIDFQEGPGILAKDFHDEGVPLVRLSGLDRSASVLAGCNFLDPEVVSKRWSHFALRKGDILLSTSASLGRIAVVSDEGVGAIPYTGIIRMRPRDERLVAPFIRYLLEGPEFQQQAEMVGVGSVIRHFGPMHLRQMTVRLPPPDEQRAIAHILGTLDDKIELNRRMNETLEAMARTLFNSWFVGFEPVRAKSESRAPSLPKPLADLFPDSFEDSELGEIPTGWVLRTIDELSEQVAMGPFGSSIKVETFVADGIPVISGQHLRGTLLDDSEYNFITEEHADQLKRSNVRRGDVVFTHAGSIGQVAYVPDTSRYERYVISQRQFYVRCDPKKMSPLFVTSYFKTPDGQHRLLANTSSTGVPSISQPVSYLRQLKIVVPPEGLLKTFDSIARTIFERVAANRNESESLGALRDSLLPKLMAGKLRVEPERFPKVTA